MESDTRIGCSSNRIAPSVVPDSESWRTWADSMKKVAWAYRRPDEPHDHQQQRLPLADDGSCGTDSPESQPRWVTVNALAVRVENCVQFGGPWRAMELIKKIGLDDLLNQHLTGGRAEAALSSKALALVICRLCGPSSELSIAEHFYRQSALPRLLGVSTPISAVAKSMKF